MDRNFYEFGAFRVDPAGRKLWLDGRPLSITPKVLDTLIVLVRNRTAPLSREELIAQVWPDTVATESNLNQAIAVLRKTLNDNPRHPIFIATLPGRGYAFIAEVRVVPSSNGNSEEVFENQAPLPTPVSPKRLGFQSRALTLTVVVLLFCAAVGWYLGRKLEAAAAARRAVKPRPSVVVLNLQNLTGRSDVVWLSAAFPAMLTTELGAGGALRTYSGDDVARAVTDVQHSTPTDSTELSSHLHAALGAEYVVTGAYTVLNSEAKQRVRIDLRIQKAEDGSLVASTSQEGDADDLFLLVSRTGVELRQDLGAGPLPRNEEGQARAAMPASLSAERAYIAGLEKLRSFAAPEAKDLLEQSVAADPSFPLAHMALSDAWHALGYQSNAKAEAKRAWELSSGLSREDQLRIEARYLRTIPDWNKAVEDFRALATFYPDNLDYAVDLAGAQSAAGKGNEALVTLSRLRHAGGEQNPRLDLAEAMAHGALSNYRAAAEAAGRAANEAHQNGQRWMMAKALLYQAGALGSAGDKAHADVVAEQARQLCEELDDRAGVAIVYRWRGIANVGSNPAEAERDFEAALRIARETGNLPEEENDLNGLAAVANNQGKLHRADEMYEQLLASGRRRDDKWAVQMALNNMGNDLLLEGRLAEAQQMEADAVAISRESGQKIGIADGLASLGQIHELQGDLAAAQRDFEESAAVYRSIGAESTTAPALAGQAEILRDRDSLNDSWDRHSSALKFFADAGDAFSMASEQLALARLDLDRGNAVDAAALAGKAAESFRNQKSDAHEALSEALLAEALAGQAKPAEARAAAQHAMNHLAHSEETLIRLQAQLAAAQALISLSDQSNQAKASEALRLRAIADEATRRGMVSLALEARAIEAAQARRNLWAARTNAALEREARDKGFLRIANVVQKSSAHL